MSTCPQTENGAVSNDTSDRSAATAGRRSGDKVNASEQLQSTVFNCGLNPALKKKKIPRVIPPPPPPDQVQSCCKIRSFAQKIKINLFVFILS